MESTSERANAEQQQRAKAYARTRRRLTYLGQALGAAYLLGWLATGAGPAVREALIGVSASPWWVVGGLGIALALPFELLTFPLAVYGGFILPHRYGQSRQAIGQWLGDVAKAWAVGGVLGLALLEGLYALLRWQPATWWLWGAAGVLGVNLLLTHLGPVVLFPLFFRFTPLGEAELRERLLHLCARAGTSVRGVFTFDLGRKTRAANAALAGLGPTRRILLSDTLCAEYSPAEIEVVLAHELGHHLHRHLGKGMVAATLGTLVRFGLADRVLRAHLPAFGVADIADVAGLPLLALVAGVLGLLSRPLGNGLSRYFERQADATALRLASEPGAMVTTMEKLADHNLADRDPHPVIAWLFHRHPPIKSRIAAAEAFVAATATGRRTVV